MVTVSEPSPKTILKGAVFAFVVAFAARSGWMLVEWIDWELVAIMIVIYPISLFASYPTASGFVAVSLVMAFVIWKYGRKQTTGD